MTRRIVLRRWMVGFALWPVGMVAPPRVVNAQQVVAATPDSKNRDRSVDDLLSRRITLTLTQVSLKRAIDTISRRAGVTVQYRIPMLTEYTASVSLHAVNLPLGVALEHVLDGTRLRVVSDGQGGLMLAYSSAVKADSVPGEGTIRGVVVDSANERGKGISGATISVKGTKLSVLSAEDGRFTIRGVPAGHQVIAVRVFGYRPVIEEAVVTANDVTTIRVRMVLAPNVLSGVVTTATGTQRKIEVGNDITTLNADSIMRVAPISSVTDLLETRVPGLTVVHSSGTPGDPSRLRLRGVGSVQGNNDPIVIVDGVRVYAQQSDARNENLAPARGTTGLGNGAASYAAPSPLDQIDPNRIATIEVLKGPSATAIYGSDAASGVIVITTKQGQAGPAHWSLDLRSGTNWLPGQWPTNYYRFGYNVSGVPVCTWDDPTCHLDSVVAFQALNDPRYTIFGHGSDQQASATVSGGVPSLIYSVTGGATTTNGYLKLPALEVQRYDSLYGSIPHSLVRPDRYNTWSVSGSVTALPSPTVRIGLQSSLYNSTQQRSALDEVVTQLAGEYISPSLLTGPLITQEYEQATAGTLTSTNALTAHWQPFAWLPLDGTGGINTMQRTDVSYVPFGVWDRDGTLEDCLSTGSGCAADTTGSYGLGRGTSRVTTIHVGTAIPVSPLKVTMATGANFSSRSTADFSVYTNSLAPGVTVPTSFVMGGEYCTGTTSMCNSPTHQSTTSNSIYGWYVEPQFNFASRFFAAPGFRLDGGSGGAHSSGSFGGLSTFPKMDFSYVAVDRQGERPLWGFLSLLRPRASYGYAGTQPAAAQKLRLFNVGSYRDTATIGTGTVSGTAGCFQTGTLDGVTTITAVCLQSLGNTQLRPERSSELEGGFDATLWQGRLSLTYSQYNKTRHDAILSIPVAPSVFAGAITNYSIQKNIGVVRNTGTEMNATAVVLENRSVGWTVGASISKNNNVVVRLNRDQLPIIAAGGTVPGAAQTRVQAGYPLFSLFTRPIAGYTDDNGDGVIESNEIRYGDSAVYIGRPDPNYQVTMTHDVSLFGGRLGAHAAFVYQNGLTQFNDGACSSRSFTLLPNKPNTSLATQAAVVAAGCGKQGQSVIGLVQVVNTFRFQSLSINYLVPPRFSSLVHVPRMSVAFQGSNLGLHTNYRGKDPNVNAFSTASRGDQTLDSGQIPEPRAFTLRITLGN